MANIRKIALDLLISYETEHRYANLLLSSPGVSALTHEELSQLTALLYTTVEKKLRYDYYIAAFASRPAADIELHTLSLLRLGMCQIFDMQSIPDFAAVNETVKLAKNRGEGSFINAVLRRAVKEKGAPPLPKREKNLLRYLSVFYSVPLPTVKFFANLFTDEGCEDFLKAVSEPSPLSVTVNENKLTRAEFMAKLGGFDTMASVYSDNGVIFSKTHSPKYVPGFSEGEFFVQDEASRIAAAALDVTPGDTVIDVCAAPGGKSFAAAIKAKDGGRVYSFDLHSSKLSLIKEGASRLGLSNIVVAENDATKPKVELVSKCDKLICDVPCSGLGVFAKKPDLRYKDISTLSELTALQYSIISASANYLKAGGVMVYSTCTVNPDENEGVTDRFIAEHPEFSYEPFSVGSLECKGKLTLLPHKHGTDGFYIAKLRKNK